MTRLAATFLRLIGRICFTVAVELDRPWRDLTFDTCPSTVPLWLDEEVDL